MKIAAVLAVLVVLAWAKPADLFFKNWRAKKFGDATFVPAKLPCAFSIVIDSVQKVGPEQNHYVRTYYKDGGLFPVVSDMQYAKYTSDYIVRPDLEDPSGKIPIFKATSIYACTETDSTKEEAEQFIHSDLTTFLDKQTFINVTDGEFQGKKCKVYYDYDSQHGMNIYQYVDDNNYVIGTLSQHVGGDMSLLEVVTYTFSVSMDKFAMDRSLYPDCNEKAYSVPQDQC